MRPDRRAGHPPQAAIRRKNRRSLDALDPVLGRALHSATAQVAATVEGRLSHGVMADRLLDPSRLSPDGRRWLSPWTTARTRFARSAAQLAAGSIVARTDVRNCFRSIRPDPVCRSLEALGCAPSEVRRVGNVLVRLQSREVFGLPIGPAASTVLANAVLSRADEALVGLPFLRWVDDYLLFADTESRAQHGLCRLTDVLGEMGLSLAPEKTSIGACDLAVSAACGRWDR
jgi:hypothetical protein